jgi:activating signal cointegrator complex subunit 2
LCSLADIEDIRDLEFQSLPVWLDRIEVARCLRRPTRLLVTYKAHNLQLHPLPPQRDRSKGKGKQRAKSEEMHMHKAAQISQIQELFPDLQNGYIMKLLDHFNDNVEAVTAALLEPDSLPPDLQDRDAEVADIQDIGGASHDLAPPSTPAWLTQRRNAYDNEPTTNAVTYRGRKELKAEPISAEEHSKSKAAILAALAAFDADDDERDDTYDVADVGGAVDNTLDTDERSRPGQSGDANEETLFRAWKDNPELFGRDSNTRVSKPRQQLQKDTGMSAEQVEGWAIMLKKDPKMEMRLSQKYSAIRAFSGNQSLKPRTKWQGNASGGESHEESEGEAKNSSDSRRMGQAGIRGNRTWGRGRGGSTAGPADDHATQIARKRKEQGRGRGGASHNRREGRAPRLVSGVNDSNI